MVEGNGSNKRLHQIIKVLRYHHIVKGLTPAKLRMILEDLGPTYVKMGQLMSMRSDMFPDVYCQEMIKLRTEVKPIEYIDIIAIVEEELSSPYTDFFAQIYPLPLGSASIAQVHAAVLLNGEKVVIKVQRPNIKEVMAADIRLMRKAVKYIKLVSKSLELIDFQAVIDELWKISLEEMDFKQESDNFKTFEKNQEHIVYIGSPVIIDRYTTSKILVMEYIDGTPIDQIESLLDLGYNMDEIGSKAAESYCKQVLDDGFFHADPHPGNIIVRDGKIIWLDFGMVGQLSNQNKLLLKKAIIAIVRNDIYELKNVLLSLGEARETINHNRLYTDIESIIDKYITMDLGSMNLGEVIQKLLDMIQIHKIAIPTDITMLGRGIITMEGLLTVCSPNVNFMQIMSSHISSNFFKDLQAAKELKRTARSLYSFCQQSMDIPVNLNEILKMTKNGQTKLNLEFTDSNKLIPIVNRMMSKLALGVVAAALFVSSSILCTTSLKPTIFQMPVIGFVGFCVAGLLTLWIVFRTIR